MTILDFKLNYIWIYSIFLLFTFIIENSFGQSNNEKFKIIYNADGRYAADSLWLERIRDDWKATGINLRIYRSAVETNDGKYNWDNPPYEVDKAINSIAKAGLDIYIRINFTLLKPNWVDSIYIDEDFHMRADGKRFLNYHDLLKRPLLNLTSEKSRRDILKFLQIVVNHLNDFPDVIKEKIKLVVPTFSPSDETEFPIKSVHSKMNSIINYELSGFSNPEISSFMNYLKKKYLTITNLNENWGEGASFNDFDKNEIEIKKYKWNYYKLNKNSKNYYVYKKGRKDFLDFRTQELKRMIDACSQIVRNAGFNFGVQFGSIYDEFIIFRGFYDPTSLIENVDHFITDDILEYYPNFAFSADYSRSLSQYWTFIDNRINPILFSTEINWPGYNGHSSTDLIKFWSMQLRNFYIKGAASIFVSHWGTIGSPANIPPKVISGELLPNYVKWKDTLAIYLHKQVVKVRNDIALDLSCERILKLKNTEYSESIHNKGIVVNKVGKMDIYEFPSVRLFKNQIQNQEQNEKKSSYNYITKYMVENTIEYLKQEFEIFRLIRKELFLPTSVQKYFYILN
ncbi:MAG: hypothetical protein R6W68_07720 [Ignavibacteriaceae bacterium]